MRCLTLALLALTALSAPVMAEEGYRIAVRGLADAGAANGGVVPMVQGGQWGLMGGDGNWVVAPQFDALASGNDGKFPARKGKKWGMVDAQGRQLLDFEFEAIGTPGDMTAVQYQGLWWVFDANGEFEKAPLQLDTLTGSDKGCFTGSVGGKATIEMRGPDAGIWQPPGVDTVGQPSEGYAVAKSAGGKTLVECSSFATHQDTAHWQEARRLIEGMQAVKQDGLWGYYAPEMIGLAIPPQFTEARDFSEGLAPVQVAGGQWGYVDRHGRIVVAPQFDAAFGFSDGLAGVTVGGKRGFIRFDGSFAIAPQFSDFWRHDGGVIPVQMADGWAVIVPELTDPAQRYDLPLQGLIAAQQGRAPGYQVIASSPHSYFAQDVVSLQSVSISPDQKVMVTLLNAAEAKEFALWDFQTKKLIRKIAVDDLTQALLLPGTEIIAAGTGAGDLLLLDAVTGGLLHRGKAFSKPILDLVLSAQGDKLAAAGPGGVRVWDLASGKALFAADLVAQKVQFAADGASVFAGDSKGGLARFGMDGAVLAQMPPRDDLGDSADALVWSQTNARPDMALSAAGVLAVLRREQVQLPDQTYAQHMRVELTQTTGRRDVILPEEVGDVLTIDINQMGNRIAYAGSLGEDYTPILSVVDAATGAEVMTRKLTMEQSQAEGTESGLFSVDRLGFVPGSDDLIVIGGEGGDIWQLDGQANRLRVVIGKPLAQQRAVVLPQGSRIYGSDGAGHLLVWDMVQGRLEARLPISFAGGTEEFIGTDGQAIYLLDGFDETVFDAVDAQSLQPIKANPADVAQITETSIVDSNGKAPDVPPEMKAKLVALGLSPYQPVLVFDNQRLAVIGESSGLQRVYEAATGNLLATLVADRSGEWVVLTPEGFFAASEHGAGLMTVANGLRSFAVDQVFQALYRPDLVAAKLAGDPEGKLAEAAAKLDLSVVLSSGPAPFVRFAAPAEGARSADQVIEAIADVTDQGGGIGRVEWRVNGLTVEVNARGLAQATGTQAKARLTLEPGENRIEVVAYNAAGLIASAPQLRVVQWDGLQSSTPPVLHVLAIGVNDYADGRLQLKFAANDARAFAEAMGRAGAGVFGQTDIVTLLDRQVTVAGLDAAFAEMATKVQPQDVFLFFLAGHGKTLDGEYHFIPADFSFEGEDPVRNHGIAQARWQQWMAGIKARKSIMIYDTCESGSVTTGSRGLEAALQQSTAITRLTKAMGRTILSAATDDAPALEGYQGHGVMTYALLDALAAGDANGNATIEVTELAGFVDARVPEISQQAFGYRQVPQMSIQGSDFALGATVAMVGAAEVFPVAVTHVVMGGTQVLDAPGGKLVQTLGQGFIGVHLVEQKDGFARIAKDGAALGWVASAALGALQ